MRSLLKAAERGVIRVVRLQCLIWALYFWGLSWMLMPAAYGLLNVPILEITSDSLWIAFSFRPLDFPAEIAEQEHRAAVSTSDTAQTVLWFSRFRDAWLLHVQIKLFEFIKLLKITSEKNIYCLCLQIRCKILLLIFGDCKLTRECHL